MKTQLDRKMPGIAARGHASETEVASAGVHPIRRRMKQARVAQICDLLCGRIAFRRTAQRVEVDAATESLPSSNRRYSRLQVCATWGFTLIEIMVVVVILGILAATIIPQFIGTTYDAKVSAAKTDVANLEAACGRFYVHMDRYPTTEEGLKALVEAPASGAQGWRGPYIKQLRSDPWGHAYQYRCPGTHHTASYDIWSQGADGADGGEGQAADIGNW